MAVGAARAAVTGGWRLDGVAGAAMAVDGVEEAATVGSSMILRGATERHSTPERGLALCDLSVPELRTVAPECRA